MRQRWKKVITCLGCRADVCFLRSLLFVRNQLHTKNTYTHTRIHTRHITFFSSFLRAFFFSLILYVFRYFLFSFFISFSLLVLVVLACILCIHYKSRTHVLIPTHHRHNAQCSMHMHVALHSLILFPTNPQYHRSRWSCIKSSNSGSNSLPMSMQPTTQSYGVLQSVNPNGFQDTEKPNEFIRWLVGSIFFTWFPSDACSFLFR